MGNTDREKQTGLAVTAPNRSRPLGGERTGLLSPCPGGGNAPAADRSNPWTSPDALNSVGSICNPGDDQR